MIETFYHFATRRILTVKIDDDAIICAYKILLTNEVLLSSQSWLKFNVWSVWCIFAVVIFYGHFLFSVLWVSHLQYVNQGVQAVRELYIVSIDSVVSGYRADGEHAARARPVRVPPRHQTHARLARAIPYSVRATHHWTLRLNKLFLAHKQTNDVSLHVPRLPMVLSRDLLGFSYAGRVKPAPSLSPSVCGGLRAQTRRRDR